VDSPVLRYARTSDGLGIAFWTMGEGPALVTMAMNCYSHVQIEAQWPEWRRWYERLACNRKIVRFDPRGSGLSESPRERLNLEAFILDLASVVDHLDLATFDLMGTWSSGPIAIAYAARQPRRVRNLILWNAWSRLEPDASVGTQTLYELIGRDWRLYTESAANQMFDFEDGALARRFAEFMRESSSPEGAAAYLEACRGIDVTDLLPRVRSPTLVAQTRRHRALKQGAAPFVASRIPDARLELVDLPFLATLTEDYEEFARLIEGFLGSPGVSTVARSHPDGLTTREIEVLRLVAAGKSNQQIAAELVISLNTVARHMSNILDKIGAANRAEAASYATRQGLV
jgi:DNA-binding CsgD family transcriptional regulator/pimeloyl-ACP methyl ester carboxylesterase